MDEALLAGAPAGDAGFSVDDALDRLRRVLGGSPDWATLASFLPEDLLEGLPTRAAIAATFVASLELVRDGHAEIRQDQKFGPIYFRGLKEETPQSPDQTGGVSLED